MSQLPSYYKKVVSVTVDFGGSGYTSAPSVEFVGGKSGTSTSAFSTAAGTAVIENGRVVAVNITNEGFDYVSTPEIVFSGGGGSGAIASANLLTIDSIYNDFAGSLHHLIQHQVPAYIRREYPQFVLFLEKYYEFLEQDGQANNILLKLESFSDIHRTLDLFLPMFKSQYLKYFPKNVSVDERLLIKFVKEFYEAKGSPRSIEFLFRLLFNENVEIYYPSENILRASDGIWLTDNVIRLTPSDSVDPFSLKGKVVDIVYHTTIGSITTEHRIEIIVLDVRKLAYTSPAIYEIIIDRNVSTIPVPGSGATATASLTADYKIDTIELDNVGIGYYAAPSVVINSYTGSGATARAYITATGEIASVSVIDDGDYYGGTYAGGVDYYFDTNSESDNDYPQVTEQTFRFNSNDPELVTELYININSVYSNSSSWLQDIADQISTAGDTGYFTIFSHNKQFLYKVVDAAIDNTGLYDYWKFIVEYQWGTELFNFAESTTIAFSPTVTLPAIEFDVAPVLTRISSKETPYINYGNLMRILSNVSITDHTLASGETNYGFKTNTIYDIFEAGSVGEYAFSGYFGEDYVQAGVNNKASVKIVSVNDDKLPTKVAIAFSGYGFQREQFTTTVTSPNGSEIEITCTTGSQYTATGRYKDSRGFLSDANKLQDNNYYQNYSYVIRSGVSARNWMEVIKNTVHPAGMAVFGELIINETVNYGINITPIEEKLHLYEFPMDVVSVQTFVFEIDFIKHLSDTATQKEFDRENDLLIALDKPVEDQITKQDVAILSVGKNTSETVTTSDGLNRDTDIIVDYVREPVEVVSTNETITFGFLSTATDTATQKAFDRDTDYIVEFTKLITFQDDLELVGDYVFDATEAYFAEDYVEEPGLGQIKVNAIDLVETEVGKNVSENVNSADQINSITIQKVLSDTANASDTVNSISPVFTIPNDDPIVSDVAVVSISKSFSDGVSVTDSAILTANKNIAESIPHGVNENLELDLPGNTALDSTHTMEHIYNDISKNTSDISTINDSGNINIQDYWADYATGVELSGDYVGSNNSF